MTTIANLKQRQALLRIMIFSFVTVMAWIGFGLFHSQQQTGISADLQTIAKPLNPNINVDAISRIEVKKAYTPEQLNSFPIVKPSVQVF